jgi:CheY-like chemotaxis protein
MLEPRSVPFRIAVIDDDPTFLELMHDLLGNGEGYDVVTCSRWIEAFEFVKCTAPDLVILDLMLGREQTGWAVLELLRSDPATSETPVILCSAAVPALDRHSNRVNGFSRVAPVAKPFDLDVMLHTVERMLAGSPRSLSTQATVSEATA